MFDLMPGRDLIVIVWIAAAICAEAVAARAHAFDCIETKCPQMRSCAEAHHKLTVCGHSKRDADNDGIPCEDLCGKDMTTYVARLEAQRPQDEPQPTAPQPLQGLGFVDTAQAADEPVAGQPAFKCSDKRTCRQMVSCEEAHFYLTQCRVKSLDGDNDGVPCNSLCR